MLEKIKNTVVLMSIFMLIVSFTSCSSSKSMTDKTLVNSLDIQKYLGTWYEISRYDHSFERDLVGVTANYSLRPDGKIKVINRGYKNTLDGEFSEAIGKAKIPDPVMRPGRLRVSFFWIFYADYLVFELDPEYQWVVIGSKSDKYLWILSRTPQLEASVYNDLLLRLQNRGYDTSKLIMVKQKIM